MNPFWKGAMMVSLAVAGIGAAAVPAEARYHAGDGWRDGRDGRGLYRGHRGWDNRHHWRGDRHWRGPRHAYRQRCWAEWRYDRYRGRNVRVRICR